MEFSPKVVQGNPQSGECKWCVSLYFAEQLMFAPAGLYVFRSPFAPRSGSFFGMIHSTAIIHPGAKVPHTASIGPYAVIDEHVELGEHCAVGPHAYLTGHLTMGSHNQFHAGCVIGDAPQDLKYKNEPTRLRLGSHNVFREHCTVQRSNKPDEDTVVGSNNFLMVNSHVGHNCLVGNHVIIANGALLAGHVTVQDRAFLSGNCLVHQFTRVGAYALMQGGCAIGKDLPPYCVARGVNGVCGLNIIGLRRAGFTLAERTELKRLYRLVFRSGMRLREAIENARKEFTNEKSRIFIEFIAASKRGLVADQGFGRSDDDDSE